MKQDLGASGMKLNSKWNKSAGGEIVRDCQRLSLGSWDSHPETGREVTMNVDIDAFRGRK